jgi:hypothetical protein
MLFPIKPIELPMLENLRSVILKKYINIKPELLFALDDTALKLICVRVLGGILLPKSMYIPFDAGLDSAIKLVGLDIVRLAQAANTPIPVMPDTADRVIRSVYSGTVETQQMLKRLDAIPGSFDIYPTMLAYLRIHPTAYRGKTVRDMMEIALTLAQHTAAHEIIPADVIWPVDKTDTNQL